MEFGLAANDALIDRTECSALVVTCSDFRFKSVEREFSSAAGLADDYDLIARPGAIRALVQPRSDAARETFIDEVKLLWQVHHFTRVLMLNHLSCRAYDDLTANEDATAVHERHLRSAVGAFAALLPGVTAEPYLVEHIGSPSGVRAIVG